VQWMQRSARVSGKEDAHMAGRCTVENHSERLRFWL
jgi:hypothetical protein